MRALLDNAARERLTAAAHAFLDDAIGRLEAAQGLPLRGRENPWLDHTRIWNLLGRDVGKDLTAALQAEMPERFKLHARMPRAEDYTLAVLRGVVAAWTIGGTYPPGHRAATGEHIAELLRLVEAPDQTVRSIRLLTHLDVAKVAGEVVEGVRLEPIRGLEETLSAELKEAVSTIDPIHVPIGSREPRALIIAEITAAEDIWLSAIKVRPTLQYAATALRLLTGASISQTVEVYGQPTMIHASSPTAVELDPESRTYWRRVGSIEREDLDGLRRMVRVFAELDARPPKKLPSLVVAIGRFNRSYRPAPWQDVVVDLSIGLEAALSSDTRDSLTLALRSRAAHLLAMPNDPAGEIFKDVGELYDFRSMVVHGSIVPEAEWTNLFNRHGIKQVLPDDRLEAALDRWRDLLRRAILARMLLGDAGGKHNGPWPLLGGHVSVDGELASLPGRRAWRRTIRQRGQTLGISRAWSRAEPLRDFLHDPWSDDYQN